MMELVGLLVMGLIAYSLVKGFLSRTSCLFWLILGFLVLAFLAHAR